MLPDSAFEEIRGHDAILLGAIGDPRIEVGLLEFGIIARLRFGLDLYVNLRPVKLYAEHLCPLKDKKPEHVDFVVVRENTEDAYAGMCGFFKKGTPDEVATQEIIFTRKGVERVIRYAFELARRARPRQEAHAGRQGERDPRDGPLDAHLRRGRRRVSRHRARARLHRRRRMWW